MDDFMTEFQSDEFSPTEFAPLDVEEEQPYVNAYGQPLTPAMVNVGGVKVFRSPEEARAWLKS